MKVSIITPSFNRADIVHETAESILKQTYTNWEWVIVEDGSTDGSWEVLMQFALRDTRIKLYKRERLPKGAASCRNIAVEKCTGDYVIFLDTDDLLATFCLQQRVDAMQKDADCDFVVFPMLLFKKQPGDMKILWNIDKPQDDIERILLGDVILQGTATIWKKSSFINIGMWKEDLLMWQDVELHLRSLLHPLKYAKRFDLPPDIFIRVSETSISRTGYHSLPKFLSRKRVFQFTIEMLIQKRLLNQYHAGMRSMFMELFINAANSNFYQEIDELLQVEKSVHLFSKKEIRQLIQYAWARKYKLYRLPGFQKIMMNSIRKSFPVNESTLNKVTYQQTIQF
jgi:glycosyltransferase involved in cell wall biosynthesis